MKEYHGDWPTFAGVCVPTGDSPEEWMAQLVGAHLSDHPVVLMDPVRYRANAAVWNGMLGRVEEGGFDGCWLIPTGGTGGEPRFVVHRAEDLFAAAKAYWRHLPYGGRNALVTLPLWHVSGLMAWVRALVAGGDVVFGDYREWLSGRFPEIGNGDFTLSLVPTQLIRLLELETAVDFLRRFAIIHVGGAFIDGSLLRRARECGLRLSPCYGMTETAAMITAMHPDDFISGREGCGQPLPGVELQFEGDGRGRLSVRCPWLSHGYLNLHGVVSIGEVLETPDFGRLAQDGGLVVEGRVDRIIISGGEKIPPEPIESLLKGLPAVRDAMVYGVENAEWGQQVCAMVEADEATDFGELEHQLRQSLPAMWIPRQWRRVDQIARNEAGKFPGVI